MGHSPKKRGLTWLSEEYSPYTSPRSHQKEQEKKRYNHQCGTNLGGSDGYAKIIQTPPRTEAKRAKFQHAKVVQLTSWSAASLSILYSAFNNKTLIQPY